jgi:hypothetical protein
MSLGRYLQTTLHPAWYHGHGKEPPFFEGWYYKLVDAGEQHPYAIIPGIFLSNDPQEAHAFVQTLDGVTGQATYHRYPVDAFWASQESFEVHVGPNRFRRDRVYLDIDTPERRVKGELHFTELTPWPVTLAAPGIMGWYGWVPFMETYHGVVSLDHRLHGTLEIDGAPVDFVGGRGYIEKDWGQSFPAAWVWFQSNHFDLPGTCITASVAIIPWLGNSFRGFIVGLWHAGTLYRFATYTGARTEALSIEPDRVHWVMRDQTYRLELHAQRAQAGLLRGPSRTDMEIRVPETLRATVDVRLTDLVGGDRTPFQGTGRHAGLEVGGDWQSLLKD